MTETPATCTRQTTCTKTSSMMQLASHVKILQEAMDEADEYLAHPDRISEGVNVHRDFIKNLTGEIERFISATNKKNKDQPLDIPEEVRSATSMIKRLAISCLTLAKAEKSLESSNKKSNTTTSDTQIVVNKAPIPPLQIPKFEGNTLNYRNFITIFDETVDKNSTLAPSQKLAYLLQYLIGDAHNLLGRIPISDANYKIARDLLQENYGGEERNISSLFERLRKLPACPDEPFALRDLHNESESLIRVLEQTGQEIKSNTYLYDEILKKYPFSFLLDVIRTENMSFEEFRQEAGRIIKLRVRLAQRTDNIPAKYRAMAKPSISAETKNSSLQPLMNIQTQAPPTPTSNSANSGLRRRRGELQEPKCSFCSEMHFSDKCPRYPTIDQRINILGDRCHKCFRKSHTDGPCMTINCFYCNTPDHHRALCPIKFNSRNIQLTFDTPAEKEKNLEPGNFLTFLAIIQNPRNSHSTKIRICIDLGSDTTLLSADTATEIGLDLKDTKFTSPKGLGGTVLPDMSVSDFMVKLLPPSGAPIELKTKLTKLVAPDLRTADIDKFKEDFPKYNLVPIPQTGQGQTVKMLLGTDTLSAILTLQKSIFVNESNQLLSTKFGFLLLQNPEHRHNLKKEEEDRTTFLTTQDYNIKKMWELDVVGLKYAEEKDSVLEEQALNKFYQTITMVDGRYQVKWPWRHFPPNLARNYTLAWNRLNSLHKKLQTHSKLLTSYDTIIQEQLQSDIIEKIPETEKNCSLLTHYIPHHAVIDLSKSTPVRIVYDASTKQRGYHSLNESILKGTNWTKNLVTSLLRFRLHEIAISADVRKAFHQIYIDPSERNVMRFLWLKDISKTPTTDNIQEYRFKRMAFGVIASPFLLYAVFQYQFAKNPSETSKILATEMYADNLLVSLPKSTDLLQFYSQTLEVFSNMRMEMAKWTSNDSELLLHIPPELKIPEEITSALGVNWNTTTDTLSLKRPKIDTLRNKIKTKRVTLQILASVFDPYGWVLPVIIRGRLFLRKLWHENLKWDKPLPSNFLEEWEDIEKSIISLTEISFARQYTPGIPISNSEIEIHTFVDASAEAVAAVSYLRVTSQNKSEISFIMAKGRVAPKNSLSIPRLELLAAIIGGRLTQFIYSNLHLKQKAKTFLWCDSKCVIAWTTTAKILPVVVARQIDELHSKKFDIIRYVPSADNPADIASRGTDFTNLQNSTWLTGPTWLIKKEDWPQECFTTDTERDELTEHTIMFLENKSIETKIDLPEPPLPMNISAFSNLFTLLRKSAHCIWILNTILRRKIIQTSTNLDYTAARRIWLRWDQACAYPSTQNLKPKETLSVNGMKIFKDEFGILRILPRISRSQLPEETKTPILLAKKTHLTTLIVLKLHTQNLHVGTSYTLAALRRSYHLPQGRREVFHILRTHCLQCKRYNTRPYKNPPVAPLPEFRVTPTSTPFKNVGIDIFGPIQIKSENGSSNQSKRWILLLTCLVIRAVHLEILTCMETSEIIFALRRFIARRGAPSMILSDNAPQFKVLNGILSDLWKTVIQSKQGSQYFAEQEIQWKFIPQYSPWMGGVYERVIQITKNAFRRTYGEEILSDKELTTVIVEVEGVLNNRPLTYIDRDQDTPILTPNNFLRVQFPAIALQTDESQHLHKYIVTSVRKDIINSLRYTEQKIDEFWNLWTEHYLLALRESTSQIGSRRPSLTSPKVGEVVLMVDPSKRRGFWRTGIIEQLITSADGEVRSAQVRVSPGNARLIRPIVKLAPFEITDNSLTNNLPHNPALLLCFTDTTDLSDSANVVDIPIVQLRYKNWVQEM